MSYASEVLADAPKAYYRMREASGLIQDSSGFGHNATSVIDGGLFYSQTPSPIITDPTDTYIDFVASDFSIPDHADLDFGDTLTAEAWIITDQLGVSRAISGRGSGALTWGLDGATDKIFIAKADVGVICFSTIAIVIATWYYLVYTKSGATSNLYMNAVDRTGVVTDLTFVNVATPLKVGSDYNDTIQWNGPLDEVAFYSTALSQERVLAHYNAALTTTAGPGDNPPIGLLGRGAGW